MSATGGKGNPGSSTFLPQGYTELTTMYSQTPSVRNPDTY